MSHEAATRQKWCAGRAPNRIKASTTKVKLGLLRSSRIKPLLPMMAFCFWFKDVLVTPSCTDSVGTAEQNGYLYVAYLLASLCPFLQQHKYVAPARAGGMTQQLCWCKRPRTSRGIRAHRWKNIVPTLVPSCEGSTLNSTMKSRCPGSRAPTLLAQNLLKLSSRVSGLYPEGCTPGFWEKPQ